MILVILFCVTLEVPQRNASTPNNTAYKKVEDELQKWVPQLQNSSMMQTEVCSQILLN